MRIKIYIKKLDQGELEFDYQYALASALYKKLAIGNIRLANKMHAKKGFKYYNFSNLIIENHKYSKKGLIFEHAHFILSSPDIEFVKSFAEGLLQEPNLRIRNQNFLVEQIAILPEVKFTSSCTFKTLSPIFVKTMREENGRLVEWDLYPKDGKFHENIHKNLVDRYTEYHGFAPRKDYFDIKSVRNFKGKRIMIGKGGEITYRRCSLMSFELDASLELMKFLYDGGIGEKNAMGFGCVEVVDYE